MTDVLFFVFGGLAVISALSILITRHVLYAACGLVVTFLSVAAIYVLAGAEFLAITQIMIYVGGIVVLLVFGVMLTNKVSGKALLTSMQNKFIGVLMGVAVFAGLVYTIFKINFPIVIENKNSNNITEIGKGIMTDYIFPFELAALLLLMTLIGAATLASYKLKEKE